MENVGSSPGHLFRVQLSDGLPNPNAHVSQYGSLQMYENISRIVRDFAASSRKADSLVYLSNKASPATCPIENVGIVSVDCGKLRQLSAAGAGIRLSYVSTLTINTPTPPAS